MFQLQQLKNILTHLHSSKQALQHLALISLCRYAEQAKSSMFETT